MRRWVFTHHKCASAWSHGVFHSLARQLGLSMATVNSFAHGQSPAATELAADLGSACGSDLCFEQNAARACVEALDAMAAPFRAVHIIRDPRDVLVSAYYSHRNVHPTDEWPALVGQRERLEQLSLEDGLIDEIDFASFALNGIGSWDYGDPRILTARYEEVVAAPHHAVAVMLRWLQLPVDEAMIRGVLEPLAFEKLAGRRRGEEDQKHHYRRGVAGDWRNHFTPAVAREFARRHGAGLVAAGYESGPGWSEMDRSPAPPVVVPALRPSAKPVVNLNVPKGGTWLLGRCIELLTGARSAIPRLVTDGALAADQIALWNVPIDQLRPWLRLRADEYLVGHITWDPTWEAALRDAGYRGVFILRDPRDLLVSRAHWVKRHPHVRTECQTMGFAELLHYLMDPEDALLVGATPASAVPHTALRHAEREVMVPPSHRRGIDRCYRDYLPWMHSGLCYTTRFERLVGERGGGSSRAQIEEVRAIAAHIGVSASAGRIAAVARDLFGGGTSHVETFRSGRIGSWRDHFDDEHKAHFKRVAGDLLLELGYETSASW
ncbi:MAG: sulfotransferase domain-containing protein [Planctomycetota bacterium]